MRKRPRRGVRRASAIVPGSRHRHASAAVPREKAIRTTGWLEEVARPLVASLQAGVQVGTRPKSLDRDPDFIARCQPFIRLLNHYYGTEVRGWDAVPVRRPFLVVGNHSGGAGSRDLWFFLGRWLEERGVEAPLYALTYDLMFAVPALASAMRRLGLVPANHANARAALRRGAGVVVFPGGDHEVFRPWSERNRIDFGGHKGFVELALRSGVTVVPMTIHGAHESTIVLTRGREIAHALGLDRLHVHVFPMVWHLPLGPMPAGIPSLQLPAKVTVQLGPRLDWSRFGPGAARDPRVVQRCYDQITGLMQANLDRLARERPIPLLSRVRELEATGLARAVRALVARSPAGPDRASRAAPLALGAR